MKVGRGMGMSCIIVIGLVACLGRGGAPMILANAQLGMFASDAQMGMFLIFCLFGLVVLAILAVVAGTFLTTALVTALKWLRWRSQVHEAAEQHQRERVRPDGQPYPPADRGMCDLCSQATEKVYYLPTGRRLCPACYEVECPCVYEEQERT